MGGIGCDDGTGMTAKPQKSEPTVAVIGAGIAGACTALSLAKRDFRVTMFDAQTRNADRIGTEDDRFTRSQRGDFRCGHQYPVVALLTRQRIRITSRLMQ